MDITTIEANTVVEAWFSCLKEVDKLGLCYKVDGGIFDGQYRKELDFVQIKIININSCSMGATRNEQKLFEYNEGYLPSDLIRDKFELANKSYTEYLQPQIDYIIKEYKCKGPNNNQLVMMIGDSTDHNPASNPCLRLIDTRIKHGKLHFFAYFRSWDLWSGFPYDTQALQNLKYNMAKQIDVEDGVLMCMSKGLHLYDYTWEYCKFLINSHVSN